MAFQDPFSSMQAQSQPRATTTTYDQGLRSYMLSIYNYMASALALTGIVALFAANTPAFLSAIYNVQGDHIVGMSGLGWLIVFSPLALIIWFNMGLQNMSLTKAQGIFWAFAVLIGLSMSSIFIVYTGESIARTFFVTAGTFGGMSLYGYTTKKDLTGMGHFLRMGVWGLIIAMLVNMFLRSSGLAFATSVIGVLIFTGLTAYDTQKLKAVYYQVGATGEMAGKIAIMGALTLYLDFINMFQFLLSFMGDRR